MTSALVKHEKEMSLADTTQLAQVLAESGFFSDSRGAAQAVTKVLAGRELGFPPIASMTGIYIVKGRVTLSANLMAAAIKRHPNYTFRVKKHTVDECAIDFVEQGEIIGTSSFTMDEARAAGLAGSETYKKFPKNMLYARALSNGAKWYCPDVFGGPIYTPDELGEEVDGETGEVVHVQNVAPPEPAPVVQAAPEQLNDQARKQLDDLLNRYLEAGGDMEDLHMNAVALGVDLSDDDLWTGLTRDQGIVVYRWMSSNTPEQVTA